MITRAVERVAGPLPDRPSPRAGRRRGDAWPLVLPALLPVALFSVYPLVQGLYLGLTDARAGRGIVVSFTGLDNVARLLSDELFWSSFRIGIVWAVSVTVLQFAAGLGLALLLDQDLRLRFIARTLALVPWAMPPVIIAIMWRLLLNPNYGPLPGGVNWLGEFTTALPAAYALARYRTRLKIVANGWVLVSQVFPVILVVVPLFLILRQFRLLDRLVGLTLVHAVYALPFALWMLRGFIAAIPATSRRRASSTAPAACGC